ncbi:MAG: Mu-like prophage major head subunit gpT family protein [Burkholderiales bacterium]|nr:Mu-like prophage major head subunit gpT family protein [Burkholderiales bacterium]
MPQNTITPAAQRRETQQLPLGAVPGVEIRDLPLQTRVQPIGEVNAETRSAEMTWTTGAAVQRYDWWNERGYLEELSLDPAHVRMDRLLSGRAPMLNTHSRWRLNDVLGVVDVAALEPEPTCTVRFSKREDVEPIYQDVLDRIIANVSVGYAVYQYERIPPTKEGEMWRYRAIDWEPFEVSLVPVGAEVNSAVRAADGADSAPEQQLRTYPCQFIDVVRSTPAAAGNSTQEERAMPPEDNTQQPAANTGAATQQNADAQQRALEQARVEGGRAEAERQTGIREAVRMGGLEPAFADELIGREGMTAQDAGLAVLREIAKRGEASSTRSAADIQTILDETDRRREAIGDAIVLRANPRAVTDAPRLAAARQYRGMTLIDMAREAIELAGGRARGLSRREIATASLNLDSDLRVRAGMQSTSDFPNILANTVRRTLRQAYQLQPRTFVPWTRMATAPDFKEVARTQLSESTVFQKVKEGGEYKAITFGDSAEKYALGKYGGIVTLTWETLVNDDLGAFDRIPFALAAEAAALEGDLVYGILTSNPAMADGTALFHANHGNLAASGSAISDTALTAGRSAMRKQTGMKGRVLNLTPSYLVVGPDKEGEANKYTSTQFVAAKSVDINPAYNTSLEVVVDPRIPGNAWHLIAEPAMVDTIEYSYLEGEDGLYTEQRTGFEVDGVQVKARHVFAAKAIDWRGLYKNGGA